MLTRRWIPLFASAGLLAPGCFDGSPQNVGDGPSGGRPRPTAVGPAAATGVMTSQTQRVFVRVGAPSTLGAMSDDQVRVTLGIEAR